MIYITSESKETLMIKYEGKMKKNIRVIPKNIHSKLRRLGNTVVAGTSIAFTENQLKSGALEHLGIYFDNGVNAYETSVIPDPLQGKYSLKNVGNDSNLLIVFYVQIMPDDFVMQLHRF